MLSLSPSKIAYHLSERAVLYSEINKKKKDHIRYGLEWAISCAYQILLALAIGFCLGVFTETLVALTTLASLRAFAGGAHFSKYGHCLIVSVALIVGIAFSGSYILSFISQPFLLYMFTYPLFLLCIFLYAPLLFKKNGVFTSEQTSRVKVISAIITVIFIILSFISPAAISIVIWQSLCYQIITLTPAGVKVIHSIDSLITSKEGLQS
ncbi:hypothetical protein HMPREF3291_00845 [Bacillus sp. HMSC76G11]|nr:hypothetical protein HMPREF3291_00845 [Bacillus sp. HMSC76G11]